MSMPCLKREELFSRCKTASNILTDLENIKASAIRDGSVDFAPWDTRILEAREAEVLAQREYERHLEIHGCNQ
jgi:hypothetical protein